MFNQISEVIGSLLMSYPAQAISLIFLLIFCETGLVVTPFLPGDSLLFILGALLSAIKLWQIIVLIIFLSTAAILGNIINYSIGKYLGSVILSKKWIKKEYLKRTEKFYKKYGVKTIILSRFIPVVRTIAPFVAGLGKMNARKFILFNIIGGFLWVSIFIFGGYFFGSIPLVKNNLSLLMLLIIIISIIPALIHYLKSKS
ncbi:SNARE associated Golgi protein [uncultured archaeon]|nr:SNARE associated Golgi protein [uncultured archaeon]